MQLNLPVLSHTKLFNQRSDLIFFAGILVEKIKYDICLNSRCMEGRGKTPKTFIRDCVASLGLIMSLVSGFVHSS